MSRVGKEPIAIPSGVDVTLEGRRVVVKGPNGTLAHQAPEAITVSRDGDTLVVTRPDDERGARCEARDVCDRRCDVRGRRHSWPVALGMTLVAIRVTLAMGGDGCRRRSRRSV